MGNIFKQAVRLFQNSGQDITSPQNGDVWMNSSTGRIRARGASVTQTVAWYSDLFAFPRQFYRTGNYYNNHVLNVAAGAGQTATAGVIYYVPIMIYDYMTMDRVAVNVTTLGASSTVRLGIYDNNNGVPGSRVADWGTISTATTGFKEITISQTYFTYGLYYFAVLTTATAPQLSAVNPSAIYAHTGQGTLNTGLQTNVYTQTTTSFPSTATPVAAATFAPLVWFRSA